VWEHRRMDPQDDPEARIRELERPLTDVAHTAGLGTEQSVGYTHIPSSGSFSAPFPAAPPRKRAVSRGW
jgi:hypothetical protein